MQDVKLTDEEIEKFNKIYDKAWSLHKGNVVLRQIYYMKLRFIRKLRLRKSIKLFKQCFLVCPQFGQSAWAIGKANQAFGNDKEH